MVRGLYIASTGMNVQSKKMDIISNDLANVSTTGYKKDTAVISSFPDVLAQRVGQVTGMEEYGRVAQPIGELSFGVRMDEVYTNFMQGSLVKTDGIVDMALQGEGFFTVQTPNGVNYTRDGLFSIDSQGNVVTKEGYSVMGENGPINLGQEFINQGGDVKISDTGEISVNGEVIDQLAIVDFEDPRTVTKIGDNLYAATEDPIAFEGKVLQGFMEASNVNPVTAMVDMIAVSRAYEANQKMIQTQDTLLGKAVNDIGRV